MVAPQEVEKPLTNEELIALFEETVGKLDHIDPVVQLKALIANFIW